MSAAQSCPTLVTSWTVARLAPLSMEFSSQEYWSGQPFPSPGDLLDLGIKPESPALQADSLPPHPSGKLQYKIKRLKKKRSCGCSENSSSGRSRVGGGGDDQIIKEIVESREEGAQASR